MKGLTDDEIAEISALLIALAMTTDVPKARERAEHYYMRLKKLFLSQPSEPV